jgi:hypothetical protein
MEKFGRRGNAVIVVVVLAAATVIVLGGGAGLVYLLSQKQKPVAVVPTTQPVQEPSKNPTTVPVKQISTLEEAMAFALTGSGMENADTAKVRGIKLLYTPTYKNWTLDFVTRSNPHKSEKTFATVYDESWVTVKIKNTGEVNLDSTINLKDQAETGPWLYKSKPLEAAVSTVFDLAKQKVVGAGLTPGQILSAEYSSLGVENDTGGYNSRWVIAVVLAGEEEKTNKKAKTVVFAGGNYKEMYDSTLTLY